VITLDIYEPQLNRLYNIMLAHYGVVADPTRISKPSNSLYQSDGMTVG
jgi:hypothetical protein